VEKNKDNEREFRLRPRKPVARGEHRVYASAFKIIMHHARMSGQRSAAWLGSAPPRRTLALTPSGARCESCIQRTPAKCSGEPLGAALPARVPLTKVIRGSSGLVPAKKASTSPRGSRIGKSQRRANVEVDRVSRVWRPSRPETIGSRSHVRDADRPRYAA